VEMLDASYRGIFLRMDAPPPERQLMKLRVALSGERDLEIHAVVVRLVMDPVGSWGVGLRFFALNGKDRADWESFMGNLIQQRARAA